MRPNSTHRSIGWFKLLAGLVIAMTGSAQAAPVISALSPSIISTTGSAGTSFQIQGSEFVGSQRIFGVAINNQLLSPQTYQVLNNNTIVVQLNGQAMPGVADIQVGYLDLVTWNVVLSNVAKFHIMSDVNANLGTLPNPYYTNTITKNGITWTLSNGPNNGQYRVTRLLDGSYCVAGTSVTVQSVSPAPQNGQNGSMLDPQTMLPQGQFQGYDYHYQYDASLSMTYPKTFNFNLPGEPQIRSIVSTRSGPGGSYQNPGNIAEAQVLTVSPLCRDFAHDTMFRPGYANAAGPGNPGKRFFRYNDIDWSKVPKHPIVSAYTVHPFANLELLRTRPQLYSMASSWQSTTNTATDNGWIAYGTYYGFDVSYIANIALHNHPDRVKALLTLFQNGLDILSVVSANDYYFENISHMSARKFNAVLVAHLTSNPDILQLLSHVKFAYDRWFYVAQNPTWWNPDSVQYTWHNTDDPNNPQSVITEVPIAQWPDPTIWTHNIGYFHQHTQQAAVMALQAKIFGMDGIWNHPALFGCVHDYMNANWTGPYNQIGALMGTPPLQPGNPDGTQNLGFWWNGLWVYWESQFTWP